MTNFDFQLKKRKDFPAVRKGMSFLEAIIALFIFVVVVVSVSQMFTSSFGSYRRVEAMQKNIESVQYAINAMAKSLRTSTIYPSGQDIVAYDHSGNGCRKFSFDNGKILVFSNSDDKVACRASSVFNDAPLVLVSQYGQGRFEATASDGTSNPKIMGKVTIRFKACSNQGCSEDNNDSVVLQTTVSLRDYNTVGL